MKNPSILERRHFQRSLLIKKNFGDPKLGPFLKAESQLFFYFFQVNLFIAVIFFIICLFLIVLPIIDDPALVGGALGIMAAGIPIYLFFIHWKNKPIWLNNMVYTWDIAIQKVFLAMPE